MIFQVPRPKPLGFDWGSHYEATAKGERLAWIDNDWKLMNTPTFGQCDSQPPYSNLNLKDWYLFNLADDWNELNDLSEQEPEKFDEMKKGLDAWLASVANSQLEETDCRLPYVPV